MSAPIPPVGGIATPPFTPTVISPSYVSSEHDEWVPVLSSPCHFGLTTFLATLKDLTLHPERNSTLILRADPLPLKGVDTPIQNKDDPNSTRQDAKNGFDDAGDLELVEQVRLKLMPKMPARDAKLDQQVLFYKSRRSTKPLPTSVIVQDHPSIVEDHEIALVIMIPEVTTASDIPYFHPPVRKLAFKWEPIVGAELDEITEADTVALKGTISIGYLPFFEPANRSPAVNPAILDSLHLAPRSTKAPRKRSPLAGPTPDITPLPASLPSTATSVGTTDSVRLHRTCLALLERLYKHGYGAMVGYQQRVKHDLVVPRNSFQDLYLVLKDRHRHLDSQAPKTGGSKVEDLKRHVFKENPGLPDDPLLPSTNLSEWGQKDIAIAAFLMLLWKDMYPSRLESAGTEAEGDEWISWGRPPGGFVDLGCGNGLLVHILTAEGYNGKGYELRSRRTWPLYPPKTRAALVELAIEPLAWFPGSIDEWESGQWMGQETCAVKEGCFLIGNHSDELTPWIPLLSLLPRTPSPYLSLPCCMHTLDALFDLPPSYVPPPHPATPKGGFEEGLESGASRYKTYLTWLGWSGLRCGWSWEKEGLRIPSTKGWGIVARKRWTKTADEERECRQWVMDEVNAVRARGAFKLRVKEGKDH